MALAADPVPRRAALAAGLGYAALYLWLTGDLDLTGDTAWRWQLGRLEWAHVIQARAPFLYEAVALVQAGRLMWLISPLNLLITALLAGLLAANVHGMLTLRRGAATHCRSGRGGAASGALPALLAGSACCAPGILLLLGIPALGAFVGLFAWLIPLSLLLLALSRGWQRWWGAPPLLGR
ncbi:hypothetical protein ACN2MM_13280 [Alkalilimnicola ehrlichii MLHE-1]|uniref:Uncharacterized protein n=1 Tax=Alkalilimnicola ehrlichii (strain ATCC BAA-1101 / DSM 17681 / MLHE-1) TaxID=187272 RepID=Q0A5P4_ALKEH|nr:hypothetical protein [Alkalilimnicola ehrlichii]ABI57843.1 conserved hypothetical protein [Alkalilimnicola ehrlichii MLHE-1]